MPKAQYEELVAKGLLQTRKGRPALTPEERKDRRRAQSRLMMEARRRAERVLALVHKDEFDALYRAEKEELERDPKYAIPEL